MATVAAVRSNPAVRTFYARLRAAGNPAKVALVAATRKFPGILNAMMRDRAPFTLPPTAPSLT